MKESRRKQLVLFLIAGLSISAPAAHAEEGDYSFWRTLYNVVMPPEADNRVAPAQRSGQYPLLSNPRSFNDGFAPRTYNQWQTVQLAPGTGAVCGDGSPYKFFFNRVPNTSNTLIYMEGGGVCTDYATCSGKDKWGARNPNGIPDNYMSLLNPGASLVSPFIVRWHPNQVKTQSWNIVYIPYCTGDQHIGDKVALYVDPADVDREPLVYHHNGFRNQRAVIAWLKDNLQRPDQVVMTGCSAGGAGAMANYHHTRRDIAPKRGFLINDSGPLFDAPKGANPAAYPSVKIHDHLRKALNLDGTVGYLSKDMPRLDKDNFGSMMQALADKYPHDRFGITHFWQDLIFSTYSYKRLYDDIKNAPNATIRDGRILERWAVDTENMRGAAQSLSNVGIYLPQVRNLFQSHCATIVDFNNGDIQEQNLELGDFIDNVINGDGPVMKASEADETADKSKRFNIIYHVVNWLQS